MISPSRTGSMSVSGGCTGYVRCAVTVFLAFLLTFGLSACTDCGGGGSGDDIILNELFPEISVPASVDFGEVNVLTYLIREVTILNEGQATLHLLNVYLLSETDGTVSDNRFEIIQKSGIDVAAGGSTAMRIKLWAYHEGPIVDSIVIESDDEDHPTVEVGLQALIVKPEIEVVPTSLYYSSVKVGDAATKKLSITNVGGGELSILDLQFDDSLKQEFFYSLPQNFDLRDTLSAGNGIKVDVTYAPLDDVSDEGYLTVISNDPVNPNTKVWITGNGVVDTPPEVYITYPSDGQSFYAGSAVMIQAKVTDSGDDEEDLELFFNSSVEGSLCSGTRADGEGNVICYASLTQVGEHVIALVALDSRNQTGADSVTISIYNEETPLEYYISGSAASPYAAFEPDDNLQVWVIDSETGDEELCVNAMDDVKAAVTYKTCRARYGDTLRVLGYDRYGMGYTLPELHLWYGDWHQAIVPEPISWDQSMHVEGEPWPGLDECQPVDSKDAWLAEHEGPAPDCLMTELEVTVEIPPQEPS